MSTNSVVADPRTPAEAVCTDCANRVIEVVRRLVDRPRSSQPRPYLRIAHSYRMSDGRRSYQRGSIWLHTHH
jgi:hypothetical protein